jgi:hypothetical protein
MSDAERPYNRTAFPLDMDEPLFERWRVLHHAGDPAPDGALTDAATGEVVTLSSLWKEPLVLEFGSLT